MFGCIENKYGRDILIIAADFSTDGVQFYEGIAEQLRDLDVAVLGKVTVNKIDVAIVAMVLSFLSSQ